VCVCVCVGGGGGGWRGGGGGGGGANTHACVHATRAAARQYRHAPLHRATRSPARHRAQTCPEQQRVERAAQPLAHLVVAAPQERVRLVDEQQQPAPAALRPIKRRVQLRDGAAAQRRHVAARQDGVVHAARARKALGGQRLARAGRAWSVLVCVCVCVCARARARVCVVGWVGGRGRDSVWMRSWLGGLRGVALVRAAPCDTCDTCTQHTAGQQDTTNTRAHRRTACAGRARRAAWCWPPPPRASARGRAGPRAG
jgi:hypothetical protein